MAVPAPGADPSDWDDPRSPATRQVPSAAPGPRYRRSNGAEPAPGGGHSGDRIPAPGRSGDRLPPRGQSGDRIPAPSRSGDRIPPGRVPGPGRSGDAIPVGATAPAGPAGRRGPSGEWPPGPPGGPGPGGRVPTRGKPGKSGKPAPGGRPKGAKGRTAQGKSGKNTNNARNAQNRAGAKGRKPKATTRPAPRDAPGKKTGGLAPVYDIDGPRIRLGVAWFLAAVAAVAAHPVTAAACYAIAAGFAARQIVRAWKSVDWQADVAAGAAAVVTLSAVGGTTVLVGVAVVALAVVVGATFFHPEGGRLPGAQGRVAAALIMTMALVPSLGGATLVLIRVHDVTAAVVLLLLVSAYEAADYIVGSGASNFIEGPLAGITTALVLGFPLMLVLMPPFDDAGWPLLVFLAATLPLGQIMASVLLPRAGSNAPALRRIDTLLLLAPVWAAAAAAF